MEKQFNTAGPCDPELHYMLDPLGRLDLEEVISLIDHRRYFVLHAPRQTGKTTTLLALVRHLNASGRYRALYANIEVAQAARNELAEGMGAVLSSLASAAQRHWSDTNAAQEALQILGSPFKPSDWVRVLLERWSESAPLPLVLMLDEVDALVGDTLIALLRQLRAGYPQRPARFPQTVILCGVRDVRDYRIHSGGEIIAGGSAFNIKAESLRLGDFSAAETQTLWLQHTEATGQTFDPAIWEVLWEDTRGQPWLVNALGHECTWKDRTLRSDRRRPVTLADYQAARERLIASRATHLDQLADKLREGRVQRVIETLLAAEAEGSALGQVLDPDDLQYVEDLGLIVTRPQVAIANRIYQEVIPRELTWTTQAFIAQETAWYVGADGRLELPRLLSAFQQFFREHADAWLEGFNYKEAGPQLLLQAFLQRIVNGGGRISREYALGRKRTDLLIEWPLSLQQGLLGPVQRAVIECKLIRQGDPLALLPEALAQAVGYAEQVGAAEAYLVLFDRRGRLSWEERCWQRQETYAGWTIGVWAM